VISFHFTDAHLTNIHLWYLLRKLGPNVSVRPSGAINSDFRWGESLSSCFIAARDRLNFGDTHEELLRGDDVRSIGQTWAHKNCVVVEREDIGLPNFPLFLTIKDAGKTEDRSLQIHVVGFLRNKNPLFCHVNASGQCVILAFGKGLMRGGFPDILNPDEDWGPKCWYVTGNDPTKPLYYTNSGKDDGMFDSFKVVQNVFCLFDMLRLTFIFEGRAKGSWFIQYTEGDSYEEPWLETS